MAKIKTLNDLHSPLNVAFFHVVIPCLFLSLNDREVFFTDLYSKKVIFFCAIYKEIAVARLIEWTTA